MSKYRFILLPIIFLFSSCNVSKRRAETISIKNKLEIQYKLYNGTPYKYGGMDKGGFDCSGFTQKVYMDAFGIKLPRTTEEMNKIGKKVSKSGLKPGDLVFFRPSRKYKHVGIYIGNKYFMHSSTSKGVTKSKLDNTYWQKKYRSAKRILNTK